MRVFGAKLLIVLVIVGLASGCSRNKEPKLLNISSSSSGPDEFAIIPNKPLQEPVSFSELPTPTPGGANRVDVTPNEDAIAALGGNPAAVSRGIPSGDSNIVNHASRYGRDGAIREKLAAEDLAFRRRKDGRVLERLLNVNVYFRAYEKHSLDQYAELERFRRAGIRTPAAPPESEAQ